MPSTCHAPQSLPGPSCATLPWSPVVNRVTYPLLDSGFSHMTCFGQSTPASSCQQKFEMGVYSSLASWISAIT